MGLHDFPGFPQMEHGDVIRAGSSTVGGRAECRLVLA